MPSLSAIWTGIENCSITCCGIRVWIAASLIQSFYILTTSKAANKKPFLSCCTARHGRQLRRKSKNVTCAVLTVTFAATLRKTDNLNIYGAYSTQMNLQARKCPGMSLMDR